MGISPLHFGFLASVAGIATMIGATCNARLVRRLGINKMLTFGWSTMVGSGAILIAASLFWSPNLTLLLRSVFIFYCGAAFIFANVNAIALGPFGDIAGTAAGLYAFIQLAGGACASYLLVALNNSSPLALGVMFLVSGVAAWSIYFIFSSRKYFFTSR